MVWSKEENTHRKDGILLMIDISLRIDNPFGNYVDQTIEWRLHKDDGPYNNITVYKYKPMILHLSFAITLHSCYLEIGLFGYSLLLDKS